MLISFVCFCFLALTVRDNHQPCFDWRLWWLQTMKPKSDSYWPVFILAVFGFFTTKEAWKAALLKVKGLWIYSASSLTRSIYFFSGFTAVLCLHSGYLDWFLTTVLLIDNSIAIWRQYCLFMTSFLSWPDVYFESLHQVFAFPSNVLSPVLYVNSAGPFFPPLSLLRTVLHVETFLLSICYASLTKHHYCDYADKDFVASCVLCLGTRTSSINVPPSCGLLLSIRPRPIFIIESLATSLAPT